MHFLIKTYDNNLKLIYNIFSIQIQYSTSKRSILKMKKKYTYYPLSHPQKRIWYSEQLISKTGILNIILTFKNKTQLDFNILENAINLFIKNNEALRTRLVNFDGEIKQYFKKYEPIKIEHFNFYLNKDEEDSFISNIVNKTFNIYNSELFYFATIKYADGKYGFLSKTHHIISDAWTCGLICKEIINYYDNIKNNIIADKTFFPGYKLFLENENAYFKSERSKNDESYWIEKYKSFKEPENKLTIKTYHSKRIIKYFNKESARQIINFCEKNNISNYNFFLSCVIILFNKLWSRDEIVIGTTTHNRSKSEEKKMLGMFINTIPIKIKLNNNECFFDFLNKIKMEIAGCFRHQKFPYDTLIHKLNRQYKIKDLFDVVFTYENMQFELENKMHHHGYDFFPFVIHITEREKPNLRAEIDYNTSIFYDYEINIIYDCLFAIIEQVIKNPQKYIKNIDFLNKDLNQKLITEFNDTKSNYLKEKTICDFFNEQVRKLPNKPALILDNDTMTYKKLDLLSNSIANFLLSKGIKKNNIIGLDLNRSFEMIICIIGVLKAGAAYLPLEPDFPVKRKLYLLENSKAKLLITDKISKYKNVPVYNIETLQKENISSEPTPKIDSSENLAYIIYTSGSTGSPKGTLIQHYNVTRVVKDTNYIDINSNDKLLQISNYAFDGSVFDIFGALLNGSTLVLLKKQDVMDINYIADKINKEKISIFFLTTVLFNTLVDTNLENLKDIRHILFGGERVSPEHVKKALKYLGPGKIIHVYGPTESTVYATYYNVKSIPHYTDTIPIGKPISNTKVYILNKYSELLPPGFPGELCISGDGISKGYLNLPELTNEKFIENPFDPGTVIYKTGDLAKWLPDGNIAFLGRIDDQVKIRGYRIEPGEIESILKKHTGIKDAVVIVRKNNNSKYLCSYLITKDLKPIDKLGEYLASSLPDYSIPEHYIYLESFPLNQNGKVDKKQLPEPDINENRIEYKKPENENQKILVKIWQEVLKINKVGIKDNFYYIGGDSIKAIQISSKLYSQNYKINTSDILKYPTIEKLSNYIEPVKTLSSQELIEGDINLTPIQKMFFNFNSKDLNHFNQFVIINTENEIDANILEKVMIKISCHHDALRIRFKKGKQINLGENTENFKIIKKTVSETGDLNLDNFIRYMQTLIDIKNGPLIILGITCMEKTYKLIISIHHLIIDGISWRILLEDIFNLYKSIEKNNDILLPKKTTSLMEWSNFLYNYSSSDKLINEFQYWKNILNSANINLIRKNKNTNKLDIQKLSFSLSKNDTKYLVSGIHKSFNTKINDILLTSLCYTVFNALNVDKILINLEGHGREQLDNNINISRTIGWFTTTFPVLLSIENGKGYSYNIKKIKEELRKIPNNGVGYGILKYLTSEKLIDKTIFNLIPEISFNFLGSMDNTGFDIESISLSKKTEELFFYPININSIINNNFFTLYIEYDNNFIKTDKIKDFIKTYNNVLLDIIKHCKTIKTINKTPTDYGDNELTINELDNIKNMINKINNI